MKIRFEGMEKSITVGKEAVASLVIENKVLFTRICQSLVSNLGQQAVEPYAVWDDEDRLVKQRDLFTIVVDPFNLPWDKRAFAGKLLEKLEGFLLEDDEARYALESLNESVRSCVAGVSLRMQSDYAFGSEWDAKRYLKAFGYGVDYSIDDPLFDSVIKFLAYAADMSYAGILVFVNLSAFLLDRQLREVMEQGIFLDLRLLFIDNARTSFFSGIELKYVIDQDLLEC